jgi:hypothetical protein
MGISLETLRCLIYAKKNGTDFTNTATIGRQAIRHKYSYIKKILNNYDIKLPINMNVIHEHSYADEILKVLGARKVDSFDYSNYEGATYIHDFNEPITDEYKNKYSLVLDGGSLEHIFNFPIAIKNLMEMVSLGGTVISSVPVNNQSGHGFYQISPELYFRIFCEENGFEIIDMLAYKAKKDNTEIYSIKDPKELGKRLVVGGLGAVNICVIAKKIEKKEIFKQWPLQSDYQVEWGEKDRVINSKNKNEVTLTQKVWNLFYQKIKNYCPVIVEPYNGFKKLDI